VHVHAFRWIYISSPPARALSRRLPFIVLLLLCFAVLFAVRPLYPLYYSKLYVYSAKDIKALYSPPFNGFCFINMYVKTQTFEI